VFENRVLRKILGVKEGLGIGGLEEFSSSFVLS
jgi:hypothetical protein